MGESGFAPKAEFLTEPCPDCQDNELSPPTSHDPNDPRGRSMGRRVSSGCERCEGFGRVPRQKPRDPYMTPLAQYG